MRTRFSLAVSILAVLCVLLLVVTACGEKATPTPTPKPGPTPTPTMVTETLLVGNASILSGPGSSLGIPQARGVEMSVELINSQGGVVAGGKRYMLKLDTHDWGYTADGGRTGAEKLMNDGCKIIIGCGTSTCTGAQQVTEPNKVLLIYGGTADAPVDKKYPYTFRILMGAGDGYTPTIAYARDKNPNNRKFFGTSFNDATGKFVMASTEPAAKALGWESFEIKLYEPGTTDFAPFITGYLIPSGANFFVLVSRSGEAGNLMKAARQFGFKGTMVWPCASGGLPEFKIAGEVADGVILTQDWDWEGQYLTDEARQLARDYRSKYGDYPTMLAFNGADAVKMLKAGIELAGSTDATAIRDVMPRVEWDSVWGGKGKLSAVGDRAGATVLHLMPIAKYDNAGGKFVNVAQAIPPAQWKE